jgi:hypothetical protein
MVMVAMIVVLVMVIVMVMVVLMVLYDRCALCETLYNVLTKLNSIGFLRFGSLDFFNNLLRDPETGKVKRTNPLFCSLLSCNATYFLPCFSV